MTRCVSRVFSLHSASNILPLILTNDRVVRLVRSCLNMVHIYDVVASTYYGIESYQGYHRVEFEKANWAHPQAWVDITPDQE